MKTLLTLILTLTILPLHATAQQPNATQLVENALHLWRGDSSYSVTEMQIHRPDWQRTTQMQSWTRGMQDSLIRFTYPPKDANNATLKLQNDMWIFTPKLNRVTKLPSSMMTQSWMGSDFSYNDLAKTDQVLHHYTHRLLASETQGNHRVFTLEAIPKPQAPIVWGKEVSKIREDYVLLETVFYDQAMQPVKKLETLEIINLSGKPFPSRMRITPLNKPGHWTEIRTLEIHLNLVLPDYLFTLANLAHPRPWSIGH